MIITEWLFDERKNLSVRFPHSPANEKFSKVFTRKAESFTNDKVKVIIIWNTQKIQSLFNNKDKVKHHSCVIYHEVILGMLLILSSDDFTRYNYGRCYQKT